MAGLYIHIPFCESRCIYCGFYSTTSLKLREAYVDALCKEMQLRPIASEIEENTKMETDCKSKADEKMDTIYLGGGTPSQLSGKQLMRLFEGIKTYIGGGEREERRVMSDESKDGENEERRGKSDELKDGEREEQRGKSDEFDGEKGDKVFEGMEITMECNPDDVTDEFCETLRKLPVNRISMGAQTFSDDRLRFLHRRHNAAEVKTAVERLRAIGIQNISIDLMFGFPGETIDDWKNDILEAIRLGVEHISAYSLMYEEGTALYRLLAQGKIAEIDEETSRQMYETLITTLTQAGYEHYEISNFARLGYRSRHNSSYWHEIPYIGLGAAAHSYNKSTRTWNVDDINEYIAQINLGKRPYEGEKLDLTTRYNDLITTALRTSDGIDLAHMQQEFGNPLAQQLLNEAQKHIDRGLMKIKDGKLSLTRKGLYISDDVMSDFMLVDE